MNILIPFMTSFTLFLLSPVTEPTVLIDQSFDLLDGPGDNAVSIGTYALHADEHDSRVRITESLELKTKRGTIGLSSSVVYQQDDAKAWQLASANGTTTVDGNTVMQVQVKPKHRHEWLISATLHRDSRGGALAEPKKQQLTITVPNGPVLFSSARAVMGPRLQTEAGEQPIVWVEFPDDIDEAINVKEDFSLVRDKPDAQGNYTLRIRSEHQTIGPLPLNPQGQLQPHHLWGEIRMREKATEE